MKLWEANEGCLGVTTLLCPECQLPLIERTVDPCSLHECAQCQGLWLHRESFSLICKKGHDSSTSRRSNPRGTSIPPWDSSPIRYRPCPQCHERMNRLNFAPKSAVIIDVCSIHGVWLDHLELERILHFIQNGGVKEHKLPSFFHELRKPVANTHLKLNPVPASRPLSNHIPDIPADLALEAIGELIGGIFDGL